MLLAVLLLCVAAGPATAAPGDLDTSFGGDGRVVSTFSESSQGNAAVVQPDGSIVVAGSFGLSPPVFAVARWLPDGRPDPAFSGDGQATLPVGGGASTADGVALQPDGKIVVAGVAGDDLALLRLMPDGTPDPAFGTGGLVTTPFAGNSSAAQAATVLSDGTIVAVGLVSTPFTGSFAIARYAADGTLLWQTTTPFAEGRAVASDVVVQPGRIVAVGVVFPPTGSRIALAGYELTGAQDATFGNGGTQDTAFPGGGAGGSGAVLTSGGQILVAGEFGAAEESFALARYTASGQLDTTFQTEGRTTTPFSQGDAGAVDVVQEPCGALAAGGGISAPTQLFALAGYGADGTLNAGFGTAGTQIAGFANAGASASAFALAPGDKLVVAGGTAGSGTPQFAVARFEGSCPPPPPPPPPPAPPAPPAPPPPPAPTALARIKTTAALLRADGTVRIALQCRTVRVARCRGVLRLRALPRSAPSRGRKAGAFMSLGRVRYSIAKGRRATEILTVSRRARRALGGRRRVAARGAARTRQPSGATRTATRRVRVLIEGGAVTGRSAGR